MKERPILFSAPMVRALLAGTKTQTRRPLRDGTWLDPKEGVIRMCSAGPATTGFQRVPCPYGQPGDRLWVRETWAPHFIYEGIKPADIPIDGGSCLFYRADDGIVGGCTASQRAKSWRPAIHMPRAASRITLEVVGVRVERLQDISEADAIAEGVDRFPGCRQDDDAAAFNRIGPVDNDSFPIARYAVLWEQINGTGSWDANPWVWVVEFKAC